MTLAQWNQRCRGGSWSLYVLILGTYRLMHGQRIEFHFGTILYLKNVASIIKHTPIKCHLFLGVDLWRETLQVSPICFLFEKRWLTNYQQNQGKKFSVSPSFALILSARCSCQHWKIHISAHLPYARGWWRYQRNICNLCHMVQRCTAMEIVIPPLS
jgi:hypothetical protein